GVGGGGGVGTSPPGEPEAGATAAGAGALTARAGPPSATTPPWERGVRTATAATATPKRINNTPNARIFRLPTVRPCTPKSCMQLPQGTELAAAGVGDRGGSVPLMHSPEGHSRQGLQTIRPPPQSRHFDAADRQSGVVPSADFPAARYLLQFCGWRLPLGRTDQY